LIMRRVIKNEHQTLSLHVKCLKTRIKHGLTTKTAQE
jgi:hypothetical protein